MLDYLVPGGRLVFIENLYTAISSVENFWHGGCWCHAFSTATAMFRAAVLRQTRYCEKLRVYED
jgi:hypothetical protein